MPRTKRPVKIYKVHLLLRQLEAMKRIELVTGVTTAEQIRRALDAHIAKYEGIPQ